MSLPAVTSSPRIPDRGLAREVDGAVTAWERLRLGRYASRPGNPCGIAVAPLGGGVAFRFPGIGYFNHARGLSRVDDAVLAEVEGFYAGIAFPHRLHLGVDAAREAAEAALEARGYRQRGGADAWLAAERPVPRGLAAPDGFTAEPLAEPNAEDFFATYLACFDSAPAGRPAALANMCLLAGAPGVTGTLVRRGGEPVAIAMLHVVGEVAFLCAGGVLEPWRRAGLQAWLVDRRLAEAREAGCGLVVSWASEDGESHRNLERAGLRAVAFDRPWVSTTPGRTPA